MSNHSIVKDMENLPDIDMQKHLKEEFQIPCSPISKNDVFYVVYSSDQKRLREGEPLFFIDEYIVDCVSSGTYRNDMPIEEQYYNYHLRFKQYSEDTKYRQFKLNMRSHIENNNMSIQYEHSHVSIFKKREDAELFIRCILN